MELLRNVEETAPTAKTMAVLGYSSYFSRVPILFQKVAHPPASREISYQNLNEIESSQYKLGHMIHSSSLFFLSSFSSSMSSGTTLVCAADGLLCPSGTPSSSSTILEMDPSNSPSISSLIIIHFTCDKCSVLGRLEICHFKIRHIIIEVGLTEKIDLFKPIGILLVKQLG